MLPISEIRKFILKLERLLRNPLIRRAIKAFPDTIALNAIGMIIPNSYAELANKVVNELYAYQQEKGESLTELLFSDAFIATLDEISDTLAVIDFDRELTSIQNKNFTIEVQGD